jgi:hypothetical protein
MTEAIDSTAVEVALCQCGCGLPAPLAARTNSVRGHVKGQPTRFRAGHNRGPTRKGPDWIEEDHGFVSPCWQWQHTRTPNGYGSVWNGAANVGAHRWMYEQRKGPIPVGLVLDHLCRNRACVNPDHLEPVTSAENCRRGANARLTADDAEQIVASSESNAVLALRFGVTRDHIKHIRAGSRWAA